jgi:hypothetical protein
VDRLTVENPQELASFSPSRKQNQDGAEREERKTLHGGSHD